MGWIFHDTTDGKTAFGLAFKKSDNKNNGCLAPLLSIFKIAAIPAICAVGGYAAHAHFGGDAQAIADLKAQHEKEKKAHIESKLDLEEAKNAAIEVNTFLSPAYTTILRERIPEKNIDNKQISIPAKYFYSLDTEGQKKLLEELVAYATDPSKESIAFSYGSEFADGETIVLTTKTIDILSQQGITDEIIQAMQVAKSSDLHKKNANKAGFFRVSHAFVNEDGSWRFFSDIDADRLDKDGDDGPDMTYIVERHPSAP